MSRKRVERIAKLRQKKRWLQSDWRAAEKLKRFRRAKRERKAVYGCDLSWLLNSPDRATFHERQEKMFPV